MASYYRRSGRRWYRGGRYYGKNYGYRRKSYKGYGQYKAAKQQADNANVVLSIPAQISCFNKTVNFGTEQAPELKQVGTYALNIYDLLRKSEFYQSYSSMYDEFKIDNVKVKLVPTTYNLTFGEASVWNSITVYTAWDRTGLSAEQLALKVDGVQSEDNVIGNNTQGNADGIYVTVGDQITTYSSAESRQVSPGSNTSITRWLKPKTMAEKSSWISTSCIDAWYNSWDNNLGRYYGISITNYPDNAELGKLGLVGSGLVNYIATWSPMTKDNPCYLQESPNLKFKPTLLVSVYPTVTDDSDNKIGFNIEAEVNVSFRGLRKAAIVNEKEVVQVQPEDNAMIIKLSDGDVITAQDSLDDEGIIHIPENVWNHVVQEVEHPDQSFVNELYLNVQDLTIGSRPIDIAGVRRYNSTTRFSNTSYFKKNTTGNDLSRSIDYNEGILKIGKLDAQTYNVSVLFNRDGTTVVTDVPNNYYYYEFELNFDFSKIELGFFTGYTFTPVVAIGDDADDDVMGNYTQFNAAYFNFKDLTF